MPCIISPFVIHSNGFVTMTSMFSAVRIPATRLNVSGWVEWVDKAPPRLGLSGRLIPV